MLNQFDQYLDRRYLCAKARKDRLYNNYSVKVGRRSFKGEVRTWKPSVSYCRYADDLVIVVKGTKVQAAELREECRLFLENELKLTLNMQKTHLTHVNDGFVFLGHRIIRRRSRFGTMSVVTTIPWDKARNFRKTLSALLSGNHSVSAVDMIRKLNARINGWANFYQFVDYRAVIFRRIDRTVFWKMAHWLARKYRCKIKALLINYFGSPDPGAAKTWARYDKQSGKIRLTSLHRVSGRPKGQFRWQSPHINLYLKSEMRSTITSRYRDVVAAMSQT